MRRFEFSDSTSNKFWEVDVKGKTLNVTFGKIGTKGQSKPKDFATPEKAKAEMEKLIKEKTGKGYVEVGGKAVKAAKVETKLPAAKLPAKSPATKPATKPAAKRAAGNKTNAGSVGEGLSKGEKTAKAEKVLAMFAGGQWELARGILEAAQDEHWLFEELLEGCSVKKGKPTFSTLINKAFSRKESAKAELVILEVLLHLPKELEELQKLREELRIKLSVEMLSKYWKEVAEDQFSGVKYGDPGNFTDQWYEAREVEIARVEKECEARSKALNKAWREEEDLGKGVKLEMVLVPAGKFVMGSPKKEDGRYDDKTQHEVTLTKPFYMGKYAVTQEQWESVMGNNPSYTKGAKLPVTDVSWKDCQEFIKKLNAKPNGGYRLPTEAEWEFACRAGTTTAYSFGDKITPSDANYNDSKVGKPMKVGSYFPNAFGLYDTHGNVWEWCEDWFAAYSKKSVIDPKGPAKGKCRVLRGGSFLVLVSYARSSTRFLNSPSVRFRDNGFRLARTAL